MFILALFSFSLEMIAQNGFFCGICVDAVVDETQETICWRRRLIVDFPSYQWMCDKTIKKNKNYVHFIPKEIEFNLCFFFWSRISIRTNEPYRNQRLWQIVLEWNNTDQQASQLMHINWEIFTSNVNSRKRRFTACLTGFRMYRIALSW